jgi:hypothetical protein
MSDWYDGPRTPIPAPRRAMRMWIGNLDGDRSGLVISSSKERARTIVGASRAEFDDYWARQSGVDQELESDVLYTRPISGGVKWQQGRCPNAMRERAAKR